VIERHQNSSINFERPERLRHLQQPAQPLLTASSIDFHPNCFDFELLSGYFALPSCQEAFANCPSSISTFDLLAIAGYSAAED